MSPDGIFYDSLAYQLSLRSVDGEVSILSGHIPYLTAVGMGECRVYEMPSQNPRRAACCGGMLSVTDDGVLLAPTTFEWQEDINLERANAAKEKAERILSGSESDNEKRLAKIKLTRANVRIKVATAQK